MRCRLKSQTFESRNMPQKLNKEMPTKRMIVIKKSNFNYIGSLEMNEIKPRVEFKGSSCI